MSVILTTYVMNSSTVAYIEYKQMCTFEDFRHRSSVSIRRVSGSDENSVVASHAVQFKL